MLLGFNDSKCTAYTVVSARGLIVIRNHLVLASGKLVLKKIITDLKFAPDPEKKTWVK